MQDNLNFERVFFIGIAGTGMSALAQYLKGVGKEVSGSDRYFSQGKAQDIKKMLEQEGILCFEQDGTGISENLDLVIVSTAIEDSVPEVIRSKELGIPIMKRSKLLSLISNSKKTIAVGGTSGKSTTTAMLFHIMHHAGLSPSIISGAGLTSLIKKGKIGNAYVGTSDYLVIEADESDGSIIQYKSAYGILLNIEKDHKDMDELIEIFREFKKNSTIFIVNQSNPAAASLSENVEYDFSAEEQSNLRFGAKDFRQQGMELHFTLNDIPFQIKALGRHNMENALAAITAANIAGNISLQKSAEALISYEGIFRRHQWIGSKNGVTLIDDFAHNPVKCAASIKACQSLSKKTIAWFQPHGYVPTKFLRNDFCKEISSALRPDDEIWMSEIFYAGGSAKKDISANDLIMDLKNLGLNAYFVEERNELMEAMLSHITPGTTILFMGARDPSLETFAHRFWESIQSRL